jgi:heme oxygenase
VAEAHANGDLVVRDSAPGGSAPVGSAPGSAHARLRAQTRGAHAAVERHLDLAGLAGRDSYCRFLLMNWACVPIELGLREAGVARLLPDWPARERRFALERDLAALGIELPPARACAIPGDAGSVFGWAYVLEGSRLGARLILRSVAASPDPDVRGGTGFLRQGEGMGLWRSFVAALSAIDDDEEAIARACAAARAGFGRFLAAACRAAAAGEATGA